MEYQTQREYENATARKKSIMLRGERQQKKNCNRNMPQWSSTRHSFHRFQSTFAHIILSYEVWQIIYMVCACGFDYLFCVAVSLFFFQVSTIELYIYRSNFVFFFHSEVSCIMKKKWFKNKIQSERCNGEKICRRAILQIQKKKTIDWATRFAMQTLKCVIELWKME